MQQSLYHYCTEWAPLEVFGRQHLSALAVSALIVAVVPWLARTRLSEQNQTRLGTAIGWTTLMGYICWFLLHLVAGSFDSHRHLPLHLCYVVAFLTPLAMTRRHFAVFEFVYYCAFSGVLQACLSPDDVSTFPHFEFLRFWVLHTGVILSAVYAVVVYRMWPTAYGVFRTWLWLLAYLAVVIFVNLVLKTNYFYICSKPPESLLDFLGPWPWYVVIAIPVAFVLLGAGYVPIWIVERWGRKSQRHSEKDG